MTDESETAFWLSVPGVRESVAEGEQDIAAGRTYGEDDSRAELTVEVSGEEVTIVDLLADDSPDSDFDFEPERLP